MSDKKGVNVVDYDAANTVANDGDVGYNEDTADANISEVKEKWL